jgi:hypothetical protein
LDVKLVYGFKQYLALLSALARRYLAGKKRDRGDTHHPVENEKPREGS